MTDKDRTLTVSWEDPKQLAEAGRGLRPRRGRVVDESGKLFARGTTTCLIMKI